MKLLHDHKEVWLCIVVGLAIVVISQWILEPLLGFWPAMAFVALASALGARITLAITEKREAR